jgi:hypothetical protein
MAASCTLELLLIGTTSREDFRTLSFLIEPALDQQLEVSDGSVSVISYPRHAARNATGGCIFRSCHVPSGLEK